MATIRRDLLDIGQTGRQYLPTSRPCIGGGLFDTIYFTDQQTLSLNDVMRFHFKTPIDESWYLHSCYLNPTKSSKFWIIDYDEAQALEITAGAPNQPSVPWRAIATRDRVRLLYSNGTADDLRVHHRDTEWESHVIPADSDVKVQFTAAADWLTATDMFFRLNVIRYPFTTDSGFPVLPPIADLRTGMPTY